VPPAASSIAETLRALRETFSALRLRWYVFGAQAAILHGSSRMTEDVDVTLEPAHISIRAILDALSAHGFVSRATDLEALAVSARVLPIEHDATRTPVDVVLAGPGLEEGFLERASVRSIAGESAPVVAAEDLITMKLLAHRPHDVEDVVAILRAQRGTLELGRTRAILEELEAVLEEEGLAARLDAAIAKAG